LQLVLPNEIFGSDSRSLNCSADQATTGDVDPPASVGEAIPELRTTETEAEKRISKVYQAAPRTETPIATAIPMAEKV